jgi:alpha/beta superfamily hydrolase
MSGAAPDAVLGNAYEETPVFLDTADGAIFGIVTRPRRGQGGTAVIVLPGGGTPLNTNRNRVSVRLCRSLASLGFTAFRMDYHGTGESSGAVDRFHLGHPFVDDVMAAVAHLKALGVKSFVLLGSTCFGSRTALATAAQLENVEEVIALATPLRDFAMGERHRLNAAARRSLARYALEALRPRTIRGMFDRRSRRLYGSHARAKIRFMRDRIARLVPGSTRSGDSADGVSPRFTEAVERLVDRGVPMVFIYGSDEDYYREFLAASDDGIAGTRSRAGSLIRVLTVPGRVHGLADVAVQDAVIELILDWATERISGRLADRRSPAVARDEGP